jgi:hypothetical protein
VVNKNKLSSDAINLKDITFDARIEGTDISSSLSEAAVSKPDFTYLFNRINSVYDLNALFRGKIDRSADDFEAFSEKIEDLYRVSDIFTQPYSFDGLQVGPMSFSINNALKLSLKRGEAAGQVTAGQPTAKSRIIVEGFRIELPTDKSDPNLRPLAVFAEQFNQSVFDISYEVNSTYSKETGTYSTSSTPLIKIDNLVSVSSDIKIEGLTEPLLQEMERTTMSKAQNLFLAADFAELGLGHLRVHIVDSSLIEKIINYIAVKEKLDPSVYRESLLQAAFLGVYGLLDGKNLAPADDIATGVVTFLSEPQSITLEVNPFPTFSLASSFGATFESIINSLNATVTFNGEAPIHLITDSDADQ